MTFGGWDTLSAVRAVDVELITAGHLVAGTIQTRFNRVADILNQLSSTHLPVENATVREHGADIDRRAAVTIVAVDEILVMLAPQLADSPSGDLRVPKQPIRTQLGIPPLWLVGSVYVPVGSSPSDGLLNLAERFVAMTDVTVSSAVHPSLLRECAVAAVRRDRADIVQFDEVTAPESGASQI